MKSEALYGGTPCQPQDESQTLPCIGEEGKMHPVLATFKAVYCLALARNRSCQSLNLLSAISAMNTSIIIDAAICNRSGRNGVDFYQECGQPTPLVFSCNTGNLEAVKILTVLGSRLHFAWSKGCCGNCSSLVEDWVNGRDCLHLAAERGFVEIAKYIWPFTRTRGFMWMM